MDASDEKQIVLRVPFNDRGDLDIVRYLRDSYVITEPKFDELGFFVAGRVKNAAAGN